MISYHPAADIDKLREFTDRAVWHAERGIKLSWFALSNGSSIEVETHTIKEFTGPRSGPYKVDMPLDTGVFYAPNIPNLNNRS